MILKFKKLTDKAISPTKAHPSDSGFDLYSQDSCCIEPGDTAIIGTGIAIELPPQFEAQIRPRSGVSASTGLIVMLGTIDNGYRGGLGIIVKNTGTQTEYVKVGMKLAQLVPVRIEEFVLALVDDFDYTETNRGSNGFGSTGI